MRLLLLKRLPEKLVVFAFPALLVVTTSLLELKTTPISQIFYDRMKEISTMLIWNDEGDDKENPHKDDKENPGKDGKEDPGKENPRKDDKENPYKRRSKKKNSQSP